MVLEMLPYIIQYPTVIANRTAEGFEPEYLILPLISKEVTIKKKLSRSALTFRQQLLFYWFYSLTNGSSATILERFTATVSAR